jgi:hypothetical protein
VAGILLAVLSFAFIFVKELDEALQNRRKLRWSLAGALILIGIVASYSDIKQKNDADVAHKEEVAKQNRDMDSLKNQLREAEDAVKDLPRPIILAPLAHANFRLSERWGDKATVSNVNGDARSFMFTVIARGSGAGMQPFVEISYPDSASKSTHARSCIQSGGSGSVTDLRWEASRTEMKATYLGLPFAGQTYTISCN